MIILTSFQRSSEYAGEKFSVASFPPKGWKGPALNFFKPVSSDGKPIHITELTPEAVKQYQETVKEAYKNRWGEIKQWLDGLSNDKDIVMCCWCPYSRSSQEQWEKHGSFYCHTALIKKLVEKHRPDIIITNDDDREKSLYDVEKTHLPPFAMRIYSEILKEEIYIVDSDETMEHLLKNGTKEVIYTIHEIMEILNIPSKTDDLTELHAIKKTMAGSSIKTVENLTKGV